MRLETDQTAKMDPFVYRVLKNRRDCNPDCRGNHNGYGDAAMTSVKRNEFEICIPQAFFLNEQNRMSFRT